MCGICGYYNFAKNIRIGSNILNKMVSTLRHRGPDEAGVYMDKDIGLGNARLSIIDLTTGKQPICNEDKSIWIVFNGEIYNYQELREALNGKGHKFATSSDTEVIVHLYEDKGMSCLDELNGQFAFAIWDKRKKELFLARDRMGIKPLFYAEKNNSFIFASEIKAIFAFSGIKAEIDEKSIDQIFTFWTTVSPRTIFKGISELPPGHYMYVKRGGIENRKYWEINFPPAGEYERRSEKYYIEGFRNLLIDATKIRLNADVPVGTYLSGGIDSSVITSIIAKTCRNKVESFSVRFADKEFDESFYQDIMKDSLGVGNSYITYRHDDIVRILSNIIWHTEIPILRTAPAPLYLLSRLVKEKGCKVILAGDGADEFLSGYNIFKELKVRMFWAKGPNSKTRPLLLKKIYPYLPFVKAGNISYLKKIFGKNLGDMGNLYYSHLLRWKAASGIKQYFSEELKSSLKGYDSMEELTGALSPDYKKWDFLARAQYLEMSLFFRNFLLSSQGDRMSMANGVENRLPFLDHRLVEFCNKMPPNIKMRALNEKNVLKKSMAADIPIEILGREKQPYRAPHIDLSSGDKNLEYILEILSPGRIKDTGYFNQDYVTALTLKFRRREKIYSEIDKMALTGAISLQMLNDLFIKNFKNNIQKTRARL